MIQQSALFQLAQALEGLPVLGCIEGHSAAQAGIRYGDILLIVNGRRTKTFADYVDAKALRADGMRVVLFRDGREQTIELLFGEREASEQALREIAARRLAREPERHGAN